MSTIERSHLDPASIQKELMGDDLDMENLEIYLKGQIRFDTVERITDIRVSRTIEGASTVDVDLQDYWREILRSGVLNSRLDIQIDGLWFRLVKVGKQGNILTLTFEDREVAILRTYHKWIIAHRNQVTRAQFVLRLIREPKEFAPPIPVIIPELAKVQPIEALKDIAAYGLPGSTPTSKVVSSDFGIPDQIDPRLIHNDPSLNTRQNLDTNHLTVKGVSATPEQIANANTILTVGQNMGARRKVLVTAIMTATQESTLINLAGGDADSVGLFQQRASWGSYQDRHDPATAAKLFFERAIKVDAEEPNVDYTILAADVQHPRADLIMEYAQWRTEAERFVMAYGIPGGDTSGQATDANAMKASVKTGADFVFYRGDPVGANRAPLPEDSWTCIQRLADEVDWRAFFVSGVFYYLAEDQLFKMQPILVLAEFSEGVEGIDGDYDQAKKSATLTLTIRVGTWLAPPGAVVVLVDMGPWNGRWLVSDFTRSLYNSQATVTLKKPRPRLPEPATQDLGLQGQPTWSTDSQTGNNTGGVYKSVGGITYPLPTDPDLSKSEFSTVDAEGAPDSLGIKHHAGKDWFAPGATKIVAPEPGVVVEANPSSGSSGQVFGGTVKIQVNGSGIVWVFRHVQPIGALAVGAKVSAGDPIASVVTWADNPASSHAHIEIWKTLSGGYVYENMIDPVQYIQSSK